MPTTTPLIDTCRERVLAALERFGKLRLATQAGIGESRLRAAGRQGWNPTAETLRRLEVAASELAANDEDAGAAAHRESAAPILDGDE